MTAKRRKVKSKETAKKKSNLPTTQEGIYCPGHPDFLSLQSGENEGFRNFSIPFTNLTFHFLNKINQHFIRAPYREKALYLSALKWALIVRFCMVFLPFKYYRTLYGQSNTTAHQELSPEQVKEAILIREIVLSVCRHSPWESKCLVQALVCKRLLQKSGIKTTMYLGVRTEHAKKKMEAHAWLKLKDRIITGQKGHRQFKVVNFYS